MKPVKRKSSQNKKSGETSGAAIAGKRADTSGHVEKTFPIVGIGASAGGLEAFSQLLKHLPVNTGMAFVLVQHLSPEHDSMLSEILSRATGMPVEEVIDGVSVEPDHVYVIPPNTNMGVLHHALQLMPRSEKTGLHLPIDYFLNSLAEDQKARSIGVILSGTASDGVIGLKSIKSAGGITFAQNEETAKYFGMPRSSIAAGFVDFVLPPDKIAAELARLGKHPYMNHIQSGQQHNAENEGKDDFNKIMIILRRATAVDFTHYKRATIRRRIMRRMVLHKQDNLAHYVRFLQTNAEEVNLLYNDILINVTGFFRDPEAFEALKTTVFPRLVQDRPADTSIRFWVPGCSSGEEVYSLAIALLEFLGNKSADFQIQLFATDINDVALDKARVGVYPENSMAGISNEQLRRYFVKVENGYRVSKVIRDMCIFARQDISADPPFSRIDLVCCRNLLIYLGQVLQKKIIPILHYSLTPSGTLMLGVSESIGSYSDLFSPVDKKNKIYAKKTAAHRVQMDFAAPGITPAEDIHTPKMDAKNWAASSIYQEVDKIVLRKFAPAGVIISEDMEILQFRGHTGRFLEPAPGLATHNLVKMARAGIQLELHAAVLKAVKSNVAVRKTGLRVDAGGLMLELAIEVIPVTPADTKDRVFLVLFAEAQAAKDPDTEPPARGKKRKKDSKEVKRIAALTRELEASKEYLNSIVEAQEASNEELRSANEEIQSSNEELQSTNEEMETAKEELQSTNEELTTINEELETRNHELNMINNDLTNILSSLQIPLLLLDINLVIRRFTFAVEQLMNIVPTDVGRKISEIKINFDVPDIENLITGVIDSLTPQALEIQSRDGKWYSLHVRPYRTADNRIDGAVLVFTDIDIVKRVGEYFERIVETINVPLVILDSGIRILMANHAFYTTYGGDSDGTIGHKLYDLSGGRWNIPRLRVLLEEIIPKTKVVENYEVQIEPEAAEPRTLIVNARELYRHDIDTNVIILSIEAGAIFRKN